MHDPDPTPPHRRAFLQQAAGLAAGAAAVTQSADAAQPPAAANALPTVRLGQHQVTRPWTGVGDRDAHLHTVRCGHRRGLADGVGGVAEPGAERIQRLVGAATDLGPRTG